MATTKRYSVGNVVQLKQGARPLTVSHTAKAHAHSMLIAGAFIPYRLSQWNAARRSLSRLVLGTGLVASLFVCSCATPYQPLNHHYGYSDQQITNHVYEVSFLGNSNTSYERAFDFALLRAAEIALHRHAKSFTLLDVVNLSSARRFLSSAYSYRTTAAGLGAVGPNLPPVATLLDWTERSYQVMQPPEEGIYYQPGVKLVVKLLTTPPGSVSPYDPLKESERLMRKYGIAAARNAK